jgi:hypothetical protein
MQYGSGFIFVKNRIEAVFIHWRLRSFFRIIKKIENGEIIMRMAAFVENLQVSNDNHATGQQYSEAAG